MFEVDALIFTVLEEWRRSIWQIRYRRYLLAGTPQATSQCPVSHLLHVGIITVDNGIKRRLPIRSTGSPSIRKVPGTRKAERGEGLNVDQLSQISRVNRTCISVEPSIPCHYRANLNLYSQLNFSRDTGRVLEVSLERCNTVKVSKFPSSERIEQT